MAVEVIASVVECIKVHIKSIHGSVAMIDYDDCGADCIFCLALSVWSDAVKILRPWRSCRIGFGSQIDFSGIVELVQVVQCERIGSSCNRREIDLRLRVGELCRDVCGSVWIC